MFHGSIPFALHAQHAVLPSSANQANPTEWFLADCLLLFDLQRVQIDLGLDKRW